MYDENWDDYRFFLAVAEQGTMSAAARTLGVSQPTVSRRVAMLEQRLETRLFDHLPNTGLAVTNAGQDILDLVRMLDETANAVNRKIVGRNTRLEGSITITATEAFVMEWLSDKLVYFMEAYPDIAVTCISDNQFLNLARRNADIAIRFGRPSTSSLIGTRLGTAHCGIYGSRSYLEEYGTPKTIADLDHHRFIDTVDPIARFQQNKDMREIMSDACTACRTNSSQVQLKFAAAGCGLVAVTCYMVTHYPSLLRVLRDAYDKTLDLWMLTHPDLKDNARVRVLTHYLIDEFRTDQDKFTGTAAVAGSLNGKDATL